MIKFTKPMNLNGIELRNELRNAGIAISDSTTSILIDTDQNLLLAIQESDKSKAAQIIDAHNGNINPIELSLEQKLEKVGLNLDDLKTALGL